jgi:hypothetical protein
MTYTMIYTSDTLDSLAALAEEVRNPPTCQAKRTTTQSIPQNTFTYVTFNGTNWNHGMTYATDGITVPKDGLYHVHAQAPWEFGGTGTKVMEVHLFTGSTDNGFVVQHELYNPGGLFLNDWNSIVQINAGQKVRLGVFQNSTGAINVRGDVKLTVSWYSKP